MPTNDTENIYSTEFENDPNPIPSSKIGYDNTESGLEATTVQGAIDELDSKIKASDEASEITYDNTESGLEAENVQAAIDELNNEKQDESYDNTTSGLDATTIDGAIDEIVSMLGDYQFIGKEAIEITIEGTVTNFLANYPTKLKEFLDAQDDDIYYLPYGLGAESRNGTTQVTSFGGNNVKQESGYKLIHKGMNASSLNIDAESTVLYGSGTKMRYRKIVTGASIGHAVFIEFDSTTTPTSFSLISHDNDVCDNVKSNLYCLKFKKVK